MDHVNPAEWLQTRETIQAHRLELTDVAAGLYPDHMRVAGTPLLSRAVWLPYEPLNIDTIRLSWQPGSRATLNGRDWPTEHVRAVDESGRLYESYAETMGALARPSVFEDRPAYRVTDADLTGGPPRLTFSRGRFFDAINVGQATAHELAVAWTAEGMSVPAELPLRSVVGDPCDLDRRSAPVAITTLTLRHDKRRDTASCILHWRDPSKVAHAGGLYQVVPVGVFQPLTDLTESEVNDLDLWRSMTREYHEEFLGGTEDYATERGVLDYEQWPFYRNLQAARSSGQLRVWCLGMGVDPFTLATDLLAVAVFDADVFDAIFHGLVTDNDEGRIQQGEGTVGIPFAPGKLEPFLTGKKPMQPAGAAVLELAWQYREALL